MQDINQWVVIGAALLTGLTPGPAMLAIAGNSDAARQTSWLCSRVWHHGGRVCVGILSALGMGALLATNQWLFETLKYAGAAYLGWLGFRAARSAMRPTSQQEPKDMGGSITVAAFRGTLIHLTNPKALFFWSSIFVIGIKPGASSSAVFWVVGVSMMINVLVVTTWALLFSTPTLMAGYLRFRRWIESASAAFFGGAAIFVVAHRTN